MTHVATDGIWETIAGEAGRESALWSAALLPPEAREPAPVFSRLAKARFALGIETIYEGYLLHYGRPRLFRAADRDTRVLLGDYLYAHGLVRIAELGDVAVVSDLAELISLCAQARAEDRDAAEPDGAVWSATAASLGDADAGLEPARRALREDGDPGPLAELAVARAGASAVAQARAAHGARVH